MVQNEGIRSSSQKLERTIKISQDSVENYDSFAMHMYRKEERQAQPKTAPFSLTKKSTLGVHCFRVLTGENSPR